MDVCVIRFLITRVSSQTSSLGGGGSGAAAGAATTDTDGAGALYSPVRAHAPRPPLEQDIEIFAKDNLNFNKGIFRRKVSSLISCSHRSTKNTLRN